MQKRILGNTERELPAIGLGCMGLSEFYGPSMEQNAVIKLLHEAIELGVEHFDTAEMYGIGSANEKLLGEAFADRRDRVSIATKFGPTRDFETGEFTGLDGSRKNCRRAVEGGVRRAVVRLALEKQTARSILKRRAGHGIRWHFHPCVCRR